MDVSLNSVSNELVTLGKLCNIFLKMKLVRVHTLYSVLRIM